MTAARRSTRRPRSQPRIPGHPRLPRHSALVNDVWHGLNDIARAEGRSVSWVIAEIVSDYFQIDCTTGRPLKARKRA